MKKNILYITYDGILEPLGNSQVYNYIKKLSNNYNFFIISFEKKDDFDNKKKILSKKQELNSNNINWQSLIYHKRPAILSTFYDIIVGLFYTIKIVKKNNINIIHARSYTPCLIALIIKIFFKIPYVFDMRGFWADEKIESKTWKKNSLIYVFTKFLEKKFIINSNYIILLTKSSLLELKKLSFFKESKKTSIISTCVSLDTFKFKSESINYEYIKKNKKIVLGYVGSVRLWYRFDLVVLFFKYLIQIYPNSILHIINKDDHEYIKNHLMHKNIHTKNYLIETSDHNEIANKIIKMDVGIFFITPSFSKKASNPTKLGEFLSSGIPCITNDGIGDINFLIKENQCGFLIENINQKINVDLVQKCIKNIFDNDLSLNCRKTAEKYLSLDKAVSKLDVIYKKILING